MANGKIGDAFIEIRAKMDTLKSDLNKTESMVVSRMKAIGAKLRTVGIGMTAAITAPLVAFGKSALSAAGDVEEMENKLSVVFGKSSKAIRSWSDNLAKNVGRSRFEIREFAADTGDMLTGMGFTEDQAASLSTQMTELAIDVASFKNAQDPQAIMAFQRALTGEREMLKSLGIVIREQDVVNKLKEMGIANSKTATQTQRAAATIELLKERTKSAVGDAARTLGSYTNQQKAMNAALLDLKVLIGTQLIPKFKPVVIFFKELLKTFTDLSPKSQQLAIALAGIAAALGPLALILGAIVTPFGMLALAIAGTVAAIMIFRKEFLIGVNKVAANWLRLWKQINEFAIKGIDMLTFIPRTLLGLFEKPFRLILDTAASFINKFMALISKVPGLEDYVTFIDRRRFQEEAEGSKSVIDEWWKGVKETLQNDEGIDSAIDKIESRLEKLRSEKYEVGLDFNIEKASATLKEQPPLEVPAIPKFNMEEAKQTTKDAGKETGTTFKDAFKSGLHISKLEDLEDIGGLFANAIERGLVNNINKSLDSLVDMIFGAFSGGSGGGGGGLGSIFGGFFADGGRPPMGKVSVVGERGPELFIPDSAGTIVPNHALGGDGGQVVVNQTIQISTGVQQTVRAEILDMMPMIKQQSVAAVTDAVRRGGTTNKFIRGS